MRHDARHPGPSPGQPQLLSDIDNIVYFTRLKEDFVSGVTSPQGAT